METSELTQSPRVANNRMRKTSNKITKEVKVKNNSLQRRSDNFRTRKMIRILPRMTVILK